MPRQILPNHTRNIHGRTPEEEMHRNLRLMMDHVGLADVPVDELGGNHPDRWRETNEREGERKAEGEQDQVAMPTRMPRQTSQEKDNSAPLNLPPDPGDHPNPVELALRLQKRMWEKKLNITELARELGRSRSYVRNHLRLLSMPNAIVEHVKAGRLSEGHARVIGKMRDPEAIARLVIRRQLSVRQTEVIARRLRYIGPDGQLLADTAIPNSKWAEDMIEDAMGVKVRIKDRAGRGLFEIHYNHPDEAREIFQGLTRVFSGIGLEDFAPND